MLLLLFLLFCISNFSIDNKFQKEKIEIELLEWILGKNLFVGMKAELSKILILPHIKRMKNTTKKFWNYWLWQKINLYILFHMLPKENNFKLETIKSSVS